MARDMGRGRTRTKGPPARLAPRFDRFDHRGHPLYRVRPADRAASGRLLHLHGGAFVYGLLCPHYAAMAKLADLSGREVWLPEYPLPPHAYAPEITDWVDSLLDGLLADGPIFLSGDSAGAGLALGAAVRRVAADLTLPQHLLLISPWADLSMTNLALAAAAKTEFLIDLAGTRAAAERFAHGLPLDDPSISPIYADLAGLPDVTIHAGAKDLLFPDIERLRRALNEAAVGGGFVIERELGHYWMFLPQPEAGRTWARIGAAIRNDEGRFLLSPTAQGELPSSMMTPKAKDA